MGSGLPVNEHWPKTRGAVSFGMGMPVTEAILGDGGTNLAEHLALAETAAGIGIDVLWYADHFSFEGEQGMRGSWDVWTLMAAIAARCRTYRSGRWSPAPSIAIPESSRR
jgi:hypothetical protein